MKFAFALIALTMASSVYTAAYICEDGQDYCQRTCPGTDEKTFHVDKVEITGELAIGETVGLKVTGTNFVTTDLENIYFKIYFGTTQIWAGNHNEHLTLEKGPFVLDHPPFKIPFFLIPAKLSIHMDISGPEDNFLQCVEAGINLHRK